MLETMNPTAPVTATAGSELLRWAASNSDLNTQRLALNTILRRVAVSEPVALTIAAHAGLLREAR